MATFNQKSDFVSKLQQVDTELVSIRGRFLVLKDQSDSQGLVDSITQEEFDKITGGIEKASLANIIALMGKILTLGGEGELKALYDFTV